MRRLLPCRCSDVQADRFALLSKKRKVEYSTSVHGLLAGRTGRLNFEFEFENMVRTLLYIIQAVGEEVIEQQLRHLTKKSSSSSSSSSSGKTSGTKTGSGSKKHKSEGIDIDIDVDHDCDYDDCNYDEGEEESATPTSIVLESCTWLGCHTSQLFLLSIPVRWLE